MAEGRDAPSLSAISVWDVAKGLVMLAGFFAVLVQVGRWWGVMDSQLQGLVRIEQTLDAAILPRINDHEMRLDRIERELERRHVERPGP